MLALYTQLCRYDSRGVAAGRRDAAAEIHPIDRDATRIWFAFFPLDLHLALESADDASRRGARARPDGPWRLADQISASHRFLFAHRYWPQVKSAVQTAFTGSGPEDLAALVSAVAEAAARTARSRSGVPAGHERRGAHDAAAGWRRRVRGRAGHRPSVRTRCGSCRRIRSEAAAPGTTGRACLDLPGGINKRWTVTFDESETRRDRSRSSTDRKSRAGLRATNASIT